MFSSSCAVFKWIWILAALQLGYSVYLVRIVVLRLTEGVDKPCCKSVWMEKVVEVIWLQATHGQLNHICQVAPMCTPSNTCFLGPMSPSVILFQPFLHRWLQSVPTLYNATLHGRFCYPSNTWFPGPTPFYIPNGSSVLHGSQQSSYTYNRPPAFPR